MSESKNTGVLIGLAALAGWLFFTSESSDSGAADQTTAPDPDTYIKNNWALAKTYQSWTGIPPVFTLAQAGLESAWGTSNIARHSKNQFGITADSGWTGDTYKGYRAYASIYDSYQDHALYLQNNSRYAPAFNTTDPTQFAAAIAKAGYATDPNYKDELNNVISYVQRVVDNNNLT